MYEDMKVFPLITGSPALHIPLAGVSYCDKSYRILREASEVEVLEYILEGEGWVDHGGVRRVGKDSIYFLPQGCRHCYWADGDAPFTKIFLNIQGPLATQLRDAYGLAGRYFFPGSGLREVFERIPEIFHSELPVEAMQAALQGILVEILCRLSAARESRNREAAELKRYLDANTGRIVTAQELARQIYRSVDYCRKLFAREFGMTVYSYQLRGKLAIARSLLENTGLSVEEIAERLGYSDAHYFSNLFKEKCGIRPLAYRKSSRENPMKVDIPGEP